MKSSVNDNNSADVSSTRTIMLELAALHPSSKNIVVNDSVDNDENIDQARHTNLTLPKNVLLVGAQKAGTTGLSTAITKSEKFCTRKEVPGEFLYEVHFFDNEERLKRGAAYYASLYEHCKLPLVYDKTPEYMFYPDRIREVYESVGNEQLENLKIIVILREPTARDLSMYNMYADVIRGRKYDGQSPRGFRYSIDHPKADTLLREDDTIMTFTEYATHAIPKFIAEKMSPSLYGPMLQNLIKYLDRKQILILSYEESKSDPDKFLSRFRDFVGLQSDVKLEQSFSNNASGAAEKYPSCSVQKQLAEAYRESNEEFYELMDKNPGPPMEQRPFLRFSLGKCLEAHQEIASTE